MYVVNTASLKHPTTSRRHHKLCIEDKWYDKNYMSLNLQKYCFTSVFGNCD